MNIAKINQLNRELEALPTITQRLNHYKANYLDKYPGDLLRKYFDAKTKDELGSGMDDIFGPDINEPISGISGQYLCPLLMKPYKNSKDQPEYNYWLLFFKAEKLFNEQYKKNYVQVLTKPLGIEFLKGERARIRNIHYDANRWLKEGKINLYDEADNSPERLYLLYISEYKEYPINRNIDDNIHVENVCLHKFCYPFIRELVGQYEEKEKEIKLIVTDVNIEAFVDSLIQKKFLYNDDKQLLIDLLNGVNIDSEIRILKKMKYFVSIIADFIDNGNINNQKAFCSRLIHQSFRFLGRRINLGSIENVMKPGNNNRVIKQSGSDFINIHDYILKS